MFSGGKERAGLQLYVKFAKFLKTPFFTDHLRWLLQDTLNTFDDFKTKQQKCMKQYFLICKSLYIFGKIIQYTIN